MNYDLDTEEGMKNAITWTTRTLALLKDGGTWGIPRSGATLTIIDRAARTYRWGSADAHDTPTARVLAEMGWKQS